MFTFAKLTLKAWSCFATSAGAELEEELARDDAGRPEPMCDLAQAPAARDRHRDAAAAGALAGLVERDEEPDRDPNGNDQQQGDGSEPAPPDSRDRGLRRRR